KTMQDIVEISFFELLLAIAKRRKFVFRFTLIAVVILTIVIFLIPRQWESRALISPIADNTSSLQLSSNLLSSFGNMPLLASQKMEMALDFLTVMDSRTFREDVIRKFNLVSYFGVNEPDSLAAMDKTLKKYNNKLFSATLEQQTNVIYLAVLTKEKQLSKDIADYVILSLENYIKYQKKVKSRLSREFLEQRTLEVTTRIDTLLALKKSFETKGKAFDLTQQTTQALELYSDLVSQKVSNDIELEVARQQYTESSPKIIELETKSALLKQKIADFEVNKGSSLPKYIINLQQLPDLNMEYNRILIDLNVMNKVYDYIYPMLEAAKLTELKDMPQIEVMDRPGMAGLHAYPQRLLLIFLLSLASLLLAGLLAILDEFISDEQKTVLRQVLTELKLIRSKKNPTITENNTEL
ncbi:MAG: Wzz/FepE/Etk N-terminal domain-containing protein, partial [Candidatus Cloacimonadaceae bacterium]